MSGMNVNDRVSVYKWSSARQYDGELMRGVEKDLSFDDYASKTGCPEALRERYEDLLDDKRREDAQKNDLFLKGFGMGV